MALVVMGLGRTGLAVARAARSRDVAVVGIDDALTSHQSAALAEIGAESVEPARLAEALADACAVIAAPGLPDRHPLFELARRAAVDVIDEFDLAQAWDDRPIAAITGTNGKTTVTALVTEMLCRQGIAAVDAGNTEVPLVEAIADPTVEWFVVEASSFRLGHARRFRPDVATWLNFAPDHLDIHRDLDAYLAAKAAIWAGVDASTTVVANANDPIVMAHLPAHGRIETFGGSSSAHRVEGSTLLIADRPVVDVGDLPRSLPQDIANALAAGATAHAAGAEREAIAATLLDPPRLPHRVAEVGEYEGVEYYDDSKATVPQATIAAVSGFSSAVLIAGGRNKGLDLATLAEVADRLRAVVAIGDSVAEVVEAFAATDVPVVTAHDMAAAVRAAAEAAEPGDAVLLSPACASFDWYENYKERGDDFAREVARLSDEGGKRQ